MNKRFLLLLCVVGLVLVYTPLPVHAKFGGWLGDILGIRKGTRRLERTVDIGSQAIADALKVIAQALPDAAKNLQIREAAQEVRAGVEDLSTALVLAASTSGTHFENAAATISNAILDFDGAVKHFAGKLENSALILTRGLDDFAKNAQTALITGTDHIGLWSLYIIRAIALWALVIIVFFALICLSSISAILPLRPRGSTIVILFAITAVVLMFVIYVDDIQANDFMNEAEVGATHLSTKILKLQSLLRERGATSPQSLPIGTILIFAHSQLPPDFVPCDGRELSVFDYRSLYDIIGATFGATAGTFRVPNLSRRVVVGAGGNGSNLLGSKIGNFGGEEKVLLKIEHMPEHKHIIPWGCPHGISVQPVPWGVVLDADGTPYSPGKTMNKIGSAATDTDNPWFLSSPSGGDTPHNNMQPSLVLMYAIKAK